MGKIVQVQLKHGSSSLITWVDKRPDIKAGATITLKEIPDKKWLVMRVYLKDLEAHDLDFHRKWDNNNYDKHKGLGL